MQSGDVWASASDFEGLVTCVSSVEAFLKEHPDVAETPEAAAALAAAELIDEPHNSATSKSMLLGRFLDSLEVLRLMSPDVLAVSPLDEIKSRRDRKLGRSKSKGGVGSAGGSSS